MEERIAHYRALAEDALELSQNSATEEQRMFFITMANSWHTLAAEIDRQVRVLPKLCKVSQTKPSGERVRINRVSQPIPPRAS